MTDAPERIRTSDWWEPVGDGTWRPSCLPAPQRASAGPQGEDQFGPLWVRADVHEAALAAAEAERDEARALVIEANNSLYGSQSYFTSLNGDKPGDKWHLARGIEALKEQARKRHAAEAETAALREALVKAQTALEPFAAMAEALDERVPDDIALAIFAGGAVRFGPSRGACVGSLRTARAALAPRATPEAERPETEGRDARCSDCPPLGYPTDKTRCADCPRRAASTPMQGG